jgi:hypothetical protein
MGLGTQLRSSIASQRLWPPSDCDEYRCERGDQAGDARIVMRTVDREQDPADVCHGVEQRRGEHARARVVVEPDEKYPRRYLIYRDLILTALVGLHHAERRIESIEGLNAEHERAVMWRPREVKPEIRCGQRRTAT